MRENLILAGGGKDVDPAFQWFLTRANGGDALVLRASGGDAYNPGLIVTQPARFDEAELVHLNAKLLHHSSFDAVKDRLPGATEAFWP